MSKALYIQCERKLSMKLKRKISRILSMTLAIMLLVPAMCADAFNFTPTSGYDDDGKAIPLELYSEAVYMVNLDSGEAIVDINGEDERVPASLTKIMTAVVLLDKFKGDEQKLKIHTIQQARKHLMNYMILVLQQLIYNQAKK